MLFFEYLAIINKNWVQPKTIYRKHCISIILLYLINIRYKKVKYMIQLVKDFEFYSLRIGELIEKSNYKTKYFIEKLEVSKPTFYRKLKDQTFTVKELVKIAELLYPQEYYEWKLNNNISESKKQYREGKFENARTTIEELRKEYQNQ